MKIIIADDHPIFRQGLIKIIESVPDFELVGEADNGEEALDVILNSRPDVAILDISMPEKSGLEIVREARNHGVETEFIILTMYKEEEYFNEAINADVKGYLVKENAASDLVNCVQSVARGKHYVSPSISDYLIHRNGNKSQPAKESPLSQLTQMERQVLKRIAENKTSKEIAGELFISYRTVQNHRTNICNKLDLKGYNKLLQFALEHRSALTDSGETVSESGIESTKSPESKRKLFGVIAAILALMVSAGWFFFQNQKEDGGGDTESTLQATAFTRNRMAVLPFVNIGSEPQDDFLTDGLTEEIISKLSRINDLRVIARTSIMKYKNTFTSIAQIKRELQVGTILEGSVRKVENQLRVTVQLIDAHTQEHLWSRDYDRNLENILAVQRDIANRVAEALRMELANTFAAHKVNPETYILYLKGRYFLNQRDETGFNQARSYFQQVIDLTPHYAPAYSGLADTFILLSNYGFMTPQQSFPKAREAALKALELTPELAEAHNSLATIHMLYDWGWQAAETEFKRALQLNPSYATAHQIYGLFLVLMGREEEAIGSLRQAVRLDPLSPIINAVLGRVYYHARRYDRAVEQFKKTIELDAEFWLVYSFLGQAYLETDMHEEAIAALKKAVELSANNPFALAKLGHACAVSGQKSQALKILNQIKKYEQQGVRLSYQIALIRAALGETDECFDWLQKAYKQRHDFMLDLKVDPKWDGLRSDPRFAALLKKMALAN